MSNLSEICTVELNLDDDFSKSTAWHVDYAKCIVEMNLSKIGQKPDRWVVVGVCESLNEALSLSEQLRAKLCAQHDRVPKNLGIEE